MAAEDVTEVTKSPEPVAPAEEPVKESSPPEAPAPAPPAPAGEAVAKEGEEAPAKEGGEEAPAKEEGGDVAAAKPAAPPKSPKPTKEELEKKALEEFKLKVAEAIKANAFVPPPPPPPPKEEPAKEEEPKDAAAAATTTEVAETKKLDEEAAEEKAPEEPAPAAAAVESSEKAVEPAVEPVAEPAAPPAAEEKIEEEPKAVEEPETPPEDVFLWGIPLLHTEGDERTDVILGKFLKARDFKVSQALAMLKNCVLWRKSFKADEILDEELGADFDGMAFMFGEDKEGHPVCYNVFGVLQDKDLYSKVFGDDAARFLRWRVQLQEKGVKMLKLEPSTPNALLQVIDLKNAPWPAKKVRSVLLKAISLLQDNYPELVIKNVFINVPWYYSAVFSLLSPFLTQHQKNKFVVTRLGKSTEALFKLISPEKVPIQYGGLGRAGDEEFSGADAPVTELPIKAGEKKTVELAVTTGGSSITWDLVVVGSEVSYGAEFQPDQEGGYTTIIVKTKKISAQLEEPIRNSFKASEPGKVVLSIDNSLSKKKKSVVYRHIVKAA
ncbi:patellin-6 [Selaginella moellendorffii]|nr:patellin-6 [Selaginella moellendorffii]|eukprot:XP_002968725.2 patellin-6 [Selaginella moellendorffii]